MPDTDPNEFTAREKQLLNHYRVKPTPGTPGIFAYNIVFAVASIGCLVAAVLRDDEALGFVGYLLLLGRFYYLATGGRQWTNVYQSVFAKYDAKVKALEEAAKCKEVGGKTE